MSFISIDEICEKDYKAMLIDDYESVIIYGIFSTQLQRTVEYMHQLGKSIVAFCDKNPRFHGHMFSDYKSGRVSCISPEEIPNSDSLVIITAMNYRTITEIRDSLSIRSIQCESIIDIVRIKEREHFNEVSKMFDNSDYLSSITYQYYKSFEHRSFPIVGFPDVFFPLVSQYFDFFARDEQVDVMLSSGGFLEQSVRNCINWQPAKNMYFFEPLEEHYAIQQEFCNEYFKERIEEARCINACLCDTDGTIPVWEINNFTLHDDRYQCEVPAIKIDTFFGEKPVDFIKLDIEGVEMRCLKGAQNTIKNNKPKIAILLHHSIFDLFEIPLFVKQIVPEYNIAIRLYESELSVVECVMYAWI